MHKFILLAAPLLLLGAAEAAPGSDACRIDANASNGELSLAAFATGVPGGGGLWSLSIRRLGASRATVEQGGAYALDNGGRVVLADNAFDADGAFDAVLTLRTTNGTVRCTWRSEVL